MPNDPFVIAVIVVIVAVVVIGFGLMTMLTRFYRKVDQGKALIINGLKENPIVTFTGGWVLPIINRAEIMDISLKTIDIDRRGKEGLICRDNIRADIKVTFFVRVNKTEGDVLKVAQSIGCTRASNPVTLEELFNAKFSEALKTVGKLMDFEQLFIERESFRDKILGVIGDDLNGYKLEDAAIDYLEQTPISNLDEHNVLDAQGIKRITERTTKERIETNHFVNEERKRIKDQNVSANKEILALEKDEANAQEAQKREIANIQAEERAAILKIQAEKRQEAEEARLKAEQAILTRDEEKNREVEVARARRGGVLAVEQERIEMERSLEAIARERKVELERMDKERELEKQRKEIADIVSDRISVEKKVAEEEERIKDLHAIKEAERSKQVKVIAAEAEAEEKLVKTLKDAEAQQEVAKFKAKERLTLAEADLEAADKTAKAKQRLAEGIQAEQAAPGLAQARVKEVTATALEKEGLAQARVKRETMQAEAVGLEQQGLAQARVKQADAEATEKFGMAEAKVEYEKRIALAKANEEEGMVQARIKQADADATEKFGFAEAAALEKRGLAEATALEKRGQAEAIAIKEKLTAEAAGLAEKAEAMKALDEVSRSHEEFRLKLQTAQAIELERLNAQRDVATAQAKVMAAAFTKAEINIVGGDGEFFERFTQAVGAGKAIDGFAEHSDTFQQVFSGYLDGSQNLPADLKEILSRPALSSEQARDLSVAALLGRMAAESKGEQRDKLNALLDQARQLGLTAGDADAQS